MVRLLIIGREAASWAKRMTDAGADALSIETARLPNEGVRRLEATPPDLVLITDDTSQGRVRTLVAGIRGRPLGELVPLVLLSPVPKLSSDFDAVTELGVDAWLSPESHVEEILSAIAEALDLSPGEFLDAGAAKLVDDAQAFLVEEVGPLNYSPPGAPTERIERGSLFPMRRAPVRAGEVDLDVLRRKLRDVRHEDYYTILELRRGAEGPVIRQAYQQLTARFDPEALSVELAQRFYAELQEIRDALEDAWAVLGDPQLRSEYLVASSRRA
ncbi:MAG: hypothetical protein AAGI01_07830 [Myxococcota bacterium]